MSYKKHQNLIKRFRIDIQKEIKGSRLFDRHVGKFFNYRLMESVFNWFKAGCQGGLKELKKIFFSHLTAINDSGMADCYLLIPTKYGLIHVELEFKTGNAKQTKEQKTWEAFIKRNNGIYMIIREDYHTSITDLKNMVECLIN